MNGLIEISRLVYPTAFEGTYLIICKNYKIDLILNNTAIGLKRKTWKSQKNHILVSIDFHCFWITSFDWNRFLLSVKTKVKKNGLSLINQE